MIGYLSKKLINLQATQEGGRKPVSYTHLDVYKRQEYIHKI